MTPKQILVEHLLNFFSIKRFVYLKGPAAIDPCRSLILNHHARLYQKLSKCLKILTPLISTDRL